MISTLRAFITSVGPLKVVSDPHSSNMTMRVMMMNHSLLQGVVRSSKCQPYFAFVFTH